jgi:hypothetical protein
LAAAAFLPVGTPKAWKMSGFDRKALRQLALQKFLVG